MRGCLLPHLSDQGLATRGLCAPLQACAQGPEAILLYAWSHGVSLDLKFAICTGHWLTSFQDPSASTPTPSLEPQRRTPTSSISMGTEDLNCGLYACYSLALSSTKTLKIIMMTRSYPLVSFSYHSHWTPSSLLGPLYSPLPAASPLFP